MISRSRYKKRKRRINFLNKFKFLNFKKIAPNYSHLLLWVLFVLIFYSIMQYVFFDLSENKNPRDWNKKQIKKLNLSELYKLKNLNHQDVRVWVLNNTNQRGLAAKIHDCLQKGYYLGETHIRGDYNILKQDNFNGRWSDGLKTEIFVHVDTINNPKFQGYLKDFLSFTGYSKDIVKYRYEEILYNERDITIKLGEDWDKTGNLVQCDNPIN